MAPLVGMARLTAVMVAALVMFWALGFQTSFLPASSSSDVDVLSSPTSQLDFMYSVLHPLLMVIGFILLTGEAILAHRTLGRWPRETRKSAHLALQGAAFGFGVFGIWAKFRANDGVVSNFLSLHSWMGLLCLALFAAQEREKRGPKESPPKRSEHVIRGRSSNWRQTRGSEHSGSGVRSTRPLLVFRELYIQYPLRLRKVIENQSFKPKRRKEPVRSREERKRERSERELALEC